ncbi:MAG: 3-dehydroquinate synthase [Phycisphaerae bacterium]
MKTVHVNIPAAKETKYDIRIGAGLLGQLGELVRPLALAPTCGVITDSNVGPKYLAAVRESLSAAGYRVIEHVIPAGEQHKNIQTAVGALDKMLNARVERATPIVALGGGVVGDLAGFVAATLLRGVPFVQVPTTLLSAVDASVGGKVGIDHAAGKNLIGAFHQPRLVVTDIATFGTLPVEEIRGGLAECIKHGVIRDAELFAFIAGNVAKIVNADLETMEELVAWNVKIKARIVEEDPFEHGVRALLNFGHTFGHAIETVLNYSGISHGQAVAAGMTAASRLAHKLGMLPHEDVKRLLTLLDYVELPTCCLNVDVEKVLAAMWTDKKVKSGQIRLILPRQIGHAEVVTGVSEGDLRWAIESLKQPIVAEKRQE